MHILLISEYEVADRSAFSGIPYGVHNGLLATGHRIDVATISPPSLQIILAGGARLETELRRLSQTAGDVIRKLRPDIVVCQGSSVIPYLDSEPPVILWHDSNWNMLISVDFETFSTIYPHLAEWDRGVASNCAAIFATSAHLQSDYFNTYGLDSTKVHILPFGHNVTAPDIDALHKAIEKRLRSDKTFLTFTGFDHTRKGLIHAVRLAERLSHSGLPCELAIIGVAPCELQKEGDILSRFVMQDFENEQILGSNCVRFVGRIAQQDPSAENLFSRQLLRSHFYIHPAQFECFGIALAEACAFGVPVITSHAYGPDTIITHGANGYKFALPTFVDSAFSIVRELRSDSDRYSKLCYQTYSDGARRFSWKNLALRLIKQSEKLLRSKDR